MVNLVIGCGENKNVLKAAKTLENNENLKINIVFSEKELISAFEDDSVDTIVRGSLKSSNLIKEIKNLNSNSTQQPINRMSFINFKKINQNYTKNNSKDNAKNSHISDSKLDGFLLGPVGIDEGNNIDEKLDIVIQCSKFLLDMKKTPKIAILAGGRKEDLGRSSTIDKSIKGSDNLVNLINEVFYSSLDTINDSSESMTKNSIKNIDSINFSVKNYYILLEKAIMEKNNIIIAPDGIIGNIIFRTLVLLNSWESNGAIAFGTKKIFIDTSRDQSKEGYIRSLNFAQKLAIKNLNENF
ncbi:hypothetical protein ALNOE001_02760 [Candidatus Methanobinarius endosymbioticus]|uniref:Phosphate acetyltransferase n=1 Tax=Candidatus Methanobinarius endosymbioticus TaxID=2006182 RepID=A0A366MDM2_9EURY|nr:hypothetical protein ALNOE001_02760 [Candidatus Methanobinarius endosymbioticus]